MSRRALKGFLSRTATILTGLASAIRLEWNAQRLSKSHDGERNESDNRLYGNRPVVPSHRYKRYNHPSEEEHRTAEQYNWRYGNSLNALIFIAASVAAIFAGLTYYQTRRQADIAQDALFASVRPWMEIEDIEPASGVRWDASGASIAFDYKIKNVGHSPAIAVDVQGELYPYAFKGPTPQVETMRFCRQSESWFPPSAARFGILFPDQSTSGGAGYVATMADIDRQRQSIAEENHVAIDSVKISPMLSIIICVNYMMQGSEKIYQTGRMLDVTKSMISDTDSLIMYRKDTARENIGVHRFLNGDFAD